MNKLWRDFLDFLSPSYDGGEESLLNINRVYCLFIFLLTPLFIFFVFEYDYHRVVLDIFSVSYFLFLFIASYKIPVVKEKLATFMFYGFLYISAVIIWINFQQNFELSLFLGMLIAFFSISLILQNHKFVLYYSGTILVLSLAALGYINAYESLEKSIWFYITMLLCFAVVSYYVIRFRTLSTDQLVYNSSLLKSVFNDSPDGLLLVNKQSNVIENCNNTIVQLLLLDGKEEIIGLDYLTFSKQFKQGRKFFQEVFLGEEEKHKEEKYLDKQGNKHWFDQVVSDISLEHDSYYLIRLTNITDKKEDELRLQKLSLAVEQNPSLVVIFESNGIIEYVNKTFETITGFTKKDMIGQNIISFGEKSEAENQAILDSLEQDEKWEGLLNYSRSNGNLLIEKAVISKITNSKGKVTHYIKVSEDVTDKIETENKLKTVLDNINEIVYSAKVNDDGTKTLEYISPLVYNLFGFYPDEFKYNDELILKHYHPDDLKVIINQKKRFNENPKPSRYTYRFKHRKTGEYIWAEENVFPQLKEDGSMKEIFGVVRDITERIEAQDKLKLSEERYRMLFSKANDAILIYEDGKIIDCNERAEVMFRSSRHDIIGASPFIFYPEKQPNGEDSIYQAYEYIQAALKGESQFYYWKHWSLDGPQFDSEVSINAFKLEGKTLLQFIIRDISARKKAEEAKSEILESYYELFDNSTDLIYIFNQNGDYVSVNKTVETLHQYNKEEIIGKSFTFLSTDALNDYRSMKQNFIEVWESGKVHKFDWWGQKKDDAIVPLEIIMNKGNFLGEQVVIARGRDISERIKYEKTLIESEEKFKTLSWSAPIGIFQENEEGKTVYINQIIKDTFKLNTEEEFNREWDNMIHPDDVAEVSKKIKETFESKSSAKYEYRVVTKEGKLIWVKVQISILMDVNSRVIGRVGTIEDVTANKNYEATIKESEERFKLLSEATIEGIALSKDGVILDVNDRFLEIYGFENRDEVIGKEIIQFTVEEERDLISERLKQEKNETKEFHHYKKNGDIIIVESRAETIPFHNEKIKVSVLNDVTNRKKAEENLVKSEQNYRRLIEILPDAIILHDQGEILFVNPEAVKMFDFEDESEIIGKQLLDFVVEEDQATIKDRIVKVQLEGDKVEYNESRISTKRGVKTIEACAMPYVFNDKLVVKVVARDVTDKKRVEKEKLRAEIAEETTRQLTIEVRERKQTEKKLKTTQEFLQNIIDSSLDMICAFDTSGKVTEFNQAAQTFFGYSEQESKKLHAKDLFAEEKEYERIRKELDKKGTFSGEVTNIRKNKDTFPSYVSVSVLKNAEGEVVGEMSVSRDITETKKSEEDLKESLKEKEVLLKEVHHRVKNNLQVISSILNLQSSYVSDDYTLDLLKECQNRIKSMSFIHESLYQSKNLSNVSFSGYIENLCNNLFYSYLVPNRRIGLSFDFEEVFLNLDTAIPCGLIVNELVSNALKYAFTGRDEGEVFVSLKPTGGNEYCLVVSDNGVGMPKGLDYLNTDSLGLQLVVTLVEQIRGTIDVKSDQGVTFTIQFKDIYK